RARDEHEDTEEEDASDRDHGDCHLLSHNAPLVGLADLLSSTLWIAKLCGLARLGLPSGRQYIGHWLDEVDAPRGIELDDQRLVVALEPSGAVTPHGDEEHGAAVLDGGLADPVAIMADLDGAGVPDVVLVRLALVHLEHAAER